MARPPQHPYERYAITDYREDDTADGDTAAWDCDLHRHGQRIAHVSSDGSTVRFSFDDPTHEAEFARAAVRQFPGYSHPADVLVQRLITNRQMGVLDEIAYCFAEDRFDELGEHRLAGPGLTFDQVRDALADLPAERGARIWDRSVGDMVRVRAVTAEDD